MTDLPAVPRGANMEDCDRCTDPNPDYPWVCPGHPAETRPTPAPVDRRERYAEAIREFGTSYSVNAAELAGVVLAVRDQELEQLRAEVEDQRAAKKTAAGAADRFRDVLSEVLGFPDENPGDDVLVAKLRTHFEKTGPEPTAWRDRLAGYEAIRDQINTAALAPTQEQP